MDVATKSKERLNFARVMVEVGRKKELPDTIRFCNEHGVIVDQNVEYEWRPVQCGRCSGFWHEEVHCRKQQGRTMWVPKKQVQQDHEGFTVVGNRAKIISNVQDVIAVHNTFQVLLDDSGKEVGYEEVGKGGENGGRQSRGLAEVVDGGDQEGNVPGGSLEEGRGGDPPSPKWITFWPRT